MNFEERKYSYFAVVRELFEVGILEPNDAYLYLLDANLNPYFKIIFERLFQFCQENLSVVCVENEYNIEPSRFFFYDCLAVNALAAKTENGYYIIYINRGTIIKLYNLFCRRNLLNDRSEYRSINDFLEEPPRSISLSYLMMQMATIFTYYHELGHLIQYTNFDGEGVSMNMAENYSFDETKPSELIATWMNSMLIYMELISLPNIAMIIGADYPKNNKLTSICES